MRDSEATVVFTLSDAATGGSAKTIALATKHKRPCLHLHRGIADAAIQLRKFAAGVTKLNVAGSRESKEPGLYAWVISIFEEAFPR